MNGSSKDNLEEVFEKLALDRLKWELRQDLDDVDGDD